MTTGFIASNRTDQNGCELLQQKRAEVEMIDLIEQVYIEEEEEAFCYDSDESVDFEIV